MISIDLFAGAGGLAMGASNAGFKHHTLLDNSAAACATMKLNASEGLLPFVAWNVQQVDVRQFDFREIGIPVELVTGGPPCQPFSAGGRHLAFNDERDLFGEAARAIRELQPKAFVFENVKGLTRGAFSDYLEYIRLRMCHPEIVSRFDETWVEHLSRLEEYETSGARGGLHYRVLHRVLDAADYGVPQRRERIFIVGFRSDISVDWHFPPPTHSKLALWWSQRRGGDYWSRHEITEYVSPEASAVAKGIGGADSFCNQPWRTVRDAIGDLPDPETCLSSAISHHEFRPGARVYKGHTGSELDAPSKALKAGVHGTAGGENMVRLADGSVRYYTIREAARLQTFPDEMVFSGTWTQIMKQIGNAVPCRLAEVILRSIAEKLTQAALPHQWRASARP